MGVHVGVTMCLQCVCSCCRLRTGILGKFLFEFHAYFNYSVPSYEDVYAAVGLVCSNLVVNILLVCGVNKDYSGRNRDLRRWWYALPWILLYGLNIVALLAAGIVALFTLEGVKKTFGLLPLGYGCVLFLFHILVSFFILEQKHKLTGVAVRPFPSVSSLVSRLE